MPVGVQSDYQNNVEFGAFRGNGLFCGEMFGGRYASRQLFPGLL